MHARFCAILILRGRGLQIFGRACMRGLDIPPLEGFLFLGFMIQRRLPKTARLDLEMGWKCKLQRQLQLF